MLLQFTLLRLINVRGSKFSPMKRTFRILQGHGSVGNVS